MRMATAKPTRTTPRTGRSGWVTFAGTYLVLAGSLNLIWGITGLANADYFVEEGLVWSSLTTWGWVAVLIGGVQVLGGALVFMRLMGGMIMALVIAMSAILFNFVTIGAYPVWSIVTIACNMLVLWAVTVHGEQMT